MAAEITNESIIPVVSIIMVTYNHEQFISEAIEGCLMQKTDFPVELVVADDASSDGTQTIIGQYANNYPGFVKPILRSINIGANPNWLDAVNKCQGRYIAICEGDDYWTDPHKLQKQVDFMDQNSDYSFCFHNVDVLLMDNEVKFAEPFTTLPDNPVTFRDVVTGNFIPTASVIFRNMIDSFPEWFSHVSSGDRALFGLLALRGNGYYIPDKMAVYRKHLAGMSEVPSDSFDVKINNSRRKLILYEGLSKASGRRYSAVLSPIIAGFYWGIMINGFRAGRILTGVKSLIMVFRYDFLLVIRKAGKVLRGVFI